ncbi:hypothetical protein EAF04_001930 [Stromatinia cepivora]|nr:hypothetical protein EAF04_001930 [Stromatinia cepivora]
MRIFEVFEPNGESRNAAWLAEQTGAEKLLLVRIMRELVSVGIFTEVDEETYTHNTRSKIFTNTLFRTLMRGMSSIMTPYLVKLPEYLSSTSFQNPSTAQQNLFQYAMNTKMSYFEWLHTQPRELQIFTSIMQASSQRAQGAAAKLVSSQFSVVDIGSNETENHEEPRENEVLIVDIGGGRGKILNNLRTTRPDLKGRMIVQDLSKEIDGREAAPGIESMTHDFFTPQPIQGAHTYFFRHIFHDWPDSACVKILRQTIPAMKKDYSRILIVDSVLPDVGASVIGSLLDINMMPLSGIERTEKHWRMLLEGEGLKVVKVQWPVAAGGSRDCVLEAVLERMNSKASLSLTLHTSSISLASPHCPIRELWVESPRNEI